MTRFVCAVLVALPIVACSSGEVPVGTSDQRLLGRSDGGKTGNGQTCSWDDAVSYDAATGKQTVHPSGNGGYNVGDTFPSPDGCNSCSCTADGIACTTKACAPKACPEIAKQCPDGSYVGPSGPNCEFVCPEPKACTTEAMQCPDGSYVGRTGPNCEFAPCP
jgi:hypothetical protein